MHGKLFSRNFKCEMCWKGSLSKGYDESCQRGRVSDVKSQGKGKAPDIMSSKCIAFLYFFCANSLLFLCLNPYAIQSYVDGSTKYLNKTKYWTKIFTASAGRWETSVDALLDSLQSVRIPLAAARAIWITGTLWSRHFLAGPCFWSIFHNLFSRWRPLRRRLTGWRPCWCPPPGSPRGCAAPHSSPLTPSHGSPILLHVVLLLVSCSGGWRPVTLTLS